MKIHINIGELKTDLGAVPCCGPNTLSHSVIEVPDWRISLGLETTSRVEQWPTAVLQLSVVEKGTPRCINLDVLENPDVVSMTINLWHLIIQISLVSVYQVSPIFNWCQPLRSITAMFPSHHLSNSLNHTTFPAQVAAVMLSCVPMHHGLAVCPVSNDHGTMMVGNRWWIGPICSQRILVLYSFIWFC